jgi:hypothetical protein
VRISRKYHGALVNAIVWSAVIVAIAACILDFGETLRLSLIAILLYWGWIVVTMYRRPETPTTMDLWLVRWGGLPLVISFSVVVRAVWHWRGLM